MNNLIAWFKRKNITAHSIAAAAVVFATIYTTDEQVRNFVIAAFHNHPKIMADITFAVGIILKYSHSSSAAGAVAAAENVMASPNPPTNAAIDAAKGTKP